MWTAPPAATGYTVFRSQLAEPFFHVVAAPVPTTHTDTTSATTGVVYYLVGSRNACGLAEWF
jgi:hypothetical protein